VNYGNYVAAAASPLFGQPVQNLNVAYLPRMLQLGFRVSFWRNTRRLQATDASGYGRRTHSASFS
jgi:hypothetical protein